MIHDTCPCCEVTRAPHEDDCTFADDCPDACAVFDYVAEIRAELAAAKADLERHRMTREEREDDAYLRVGNPQRIPIHPCPFCGCDEEEETYEDMALTVFRDTSHATWHLVQCRCCNASGPTGDGIAGAIELWNRPLKGHLDRTKEGE